MMMVMSMSAAATVASNDADASMSDDAGCMNVMTDEDF